jgi:predicted RNase H-like HicB family nuclease
MANKTITGSHNYSFNVFWSEEDASYIAVCPEFSGLSAFGETAEQALAEMEIALDLAIETYQEEGWTLPEPMAYTTQQPSYETVSGGVVGESAGGDSSEVA